MSESSNELNELRRRLTSGGGEDATDGQRRLRKLAAALVGAEHDDADCQRCQEQLPQMAEAELRGERIAQLFSDAVAHMDICEKCSLEYAELIDALLELEETVGASTGLPLPALPARLRLVMRLRGWFRDTVRQVSERLRLADSASFEPVIETFLERLTEWPALPPPLPAGQVALGFGGEGDAVPVMMAHWAVTEALAEGYTSDELRELAGSGRLLEVVRQMADDTARQRRLGRRLRGQFVEEYVAGVAQDPEAFIALGRD